jgi:integrase/recombinase XerC
VPGSAETTALAAAAESYLGWLRDQRRASPHTLTAVRRDLAGLLRALQAAGCETPAQVEVHVLRRWLTQLHREGHQPASLHRYLASARGWFRWLVERGDLGVNPVLGVRAPRQRRKLPDVIPADSLGAALDAPAEDARAVRDRALVEVFYSTGLRLAELQTLDAASVNAGQTELRVLGKGRKERLVWLGSKARLAVDAWLALRSDWLRGEEPALFLNPRGGRLSRSGIAQALKDWAARTGLGSALHPHRLRHAFATHLLEETGDLRAVQELLGHAHLATTQIYTQVDFRRLAEVYDGAHPRARKRRAP